MRPGPEERGPLGGGGERCKTGIVGQRHHVRNQGGNEGSRNGQRDARHARGRPQQPIGTADVGLDGRQSCLELSGDTIEPRLVLLFGRAELTLVDDLDRLLTGSKAQSGQANVETGQSRISRTEGLAAG